MGIRFFSAYKVDNYLEEVLFISRNKLSINEEIKDKEIRLIDDEGNMLGILPLAKAQELANSKNLDLVKIAPQESVPVCKIMD